MLRAVRDYNAQGFTTFMDGGIGLSGSYKTDMAAYLSLARDKALDARGYLQFMPPVLDALEPYGLWGFPSEYLSFGGVKYLRTVPSKATPEPCLKTTTPAPVTAASWSARLKSSTTLSCTIMPRAFR